MPSRCPMESAQFTKDLIENVGAYLFYLAGRPRSLARRWHAPAQHKVRHGAPAKLRRWQAPQSGRTPPSPCSRRRVAISTAAASSTRSRRQAKSSTPFVSTSRVRRCSKNMWRWTIAVMRRCSRGGERAQCGSATTALSGAATCTHAAASFRAPLLAGGMQMLRRWPPATTLKWCGRNFGTRCSNAPSTARPSRRLLTLARPRGATRVGTAATRIRRAPPSLSLLQPQLLRARRLQQRAQHSRRATRCRRSSRHGSHHRHRPSRALSARSIGCGSGSTSRRAVNVLRRWQHQFLIATGANDPSIRTRSCRCRRGRPPMRTCPPIDASSSAKRRHGQCRLGIRRGREGMLRVTKGGRVRRARRGREAQPALRRR